MVENKRNKQIEWISEEPIPHFRYDGKAYFALNDSIEVLIDGVVYRVKSVYSEKSFMGDMLDSLTMVQINRNAT
jgi:hypothetical protein